MKMPENAEQHETSRGTGSSRRRFLQGLSGGTVATLVAAGPAGLLPGAAVAQDQLPRARKGGPRVRFQRSRLVMLRKGDVAIIGGSLAAVAAALQFARAGGKVVLVEHRNYLGREIAAPLKPWVDLGKLAAAGQVPELFAAALKKQATTPAAGEIPLWMDGFKLSLEDLLLDAGVELVYASLPTQILTAGGAIRGVVIGNKSGRQAVLGRLVLDATSTAVVARIAGAEFAPETAEDYRVVRVIEMDAVRPLDQATLAVPAELGIAGNKLTVHDGYRGNGHVLIECPMELNLGRLDLEGMMQREIEARHRSMRVAAHLIQNVASFKEAKLAMLCALELDGPQTTRLAGPVPGWVAEFKGDLAFSDKNQAGVRLPLAGFAGPVKGLWCLNEAARLEGPRRELLRDPVNAALAGAAFANALLPTLGDGEIPVPEETDYRIEEHLPHSLEVMHQDSPQRGRFYERLTVPPLEVPVFRETDVLVVGGGTSGATCAGAAAREGVQTVLLELCSGLGGTGTIGGMCKHYYGRYWAGFAARNCQMVDEVHQTVNWPPTSQLNDLESRRAHCIERLQKGGTSAEAAGRTCRQTFMMPDGLWNIECKAYALLRDTQRSGAEVFFQVTAFAAVLEDNRVCGAVAATPYGPVAVLSKVTADTTGDGDIAAFAGAKFTFGDGRDHYPMWFNMAQYLTPTLSRNHSMHTVDVTNVEDYARGVLIGRHRSPPVHDHGNYLATRESRHIIGDVLVTATDLLRHRQFPDVINLGAGRMDAVGRIGSDWMRMGLMLPILATELPYRALLPQGLENILVAGKAFSANHDALWNLRNQPEIENLGGAVAVALAFAVRDGVSPRKVDLRKVQKRLTEVGTLLPEMLTRQIKEEPLDEAAVRAFVKELDGRHFGAWDGVHLEREGTPDFRKKIPIVEICTADPAVAVPILEQELSQATGDRQLRLAQALAWFGSRAAVPVLIAAIEQSIASGAAHPPDNPNAARPREQGKPTPPADLMFSLGMARDPRALAIWEKVATVVRNAEPQNFSASLPWPYYYVDAICYGAELLCNPAAIPILQSIHDEPLLKDQSVKKGFQPNYDLEKRALIELILGRALAHLGSPAGYETLIEYLDDNRAALAEFAHFTLETLTRSNHGKDPRAWRYWLAGAQGSLKPIPPLERVDS